MFERAKGDAGSTTDQGNAREKPDSHVQARHTKSCECLQYFSEATLTQCRGDEHEFCSGSSIKAL